MTARDRCDGFCTVKISGLVAIVQLWFRIVESRGRVAGETDPIRALLVVIASSDGFAQAQRTPSRKSLRDFSPPSPMAALQL